MRMDHRIFTQLKIFKNFISLHSFEIILKIVKNYDKKERAMKIMRLKKLKNHKNLYQIKGKDY